MIYAPPYTVVPVDCSAAILSGAPKQITDRNTNVRRIIVRKLAVIAEICLQLGINGAPIPMRQDNEIEFPDVPCDSGIYLSCAAGGANAVATLVVVHAGDAGQPSQAFRVRAT